jgi:hypothetical protein
LILSIPGLDIGFAYFPVEQSRRRLLQREATKKEADTEEV